MKTEKKATPILMLACMATAVVCACQPDQDKRLRVGEENPRYFVDGSGKAVLLVGSHTWNNFVEMNSLSEPDTFDYKGYLDFLEEYHHNFFRFWRWDLLAWDSAGSLHNLRVGPHPWQRTGPGVAIDGLPRFDLTQFNQDYFDRLRRRVLMAQDRNMYVAIMLFEGWGIQFSPHALDHHPFNPMNNVTLLSVDTTQKGVRIYELGNDELLALQEAYVRKVIETVNDLDNVLYEISNENHPGSTDWQYHMINLIKTYEKDLGHTHPVGMTFQYRGGSNKTLFESPADWISPNPEGGYRDDPPVADGSKVIITDTDHLWGIGGDRAWVWKSFLRGMNVLFMDPYDGRVLTLDTTRLPAIDIRKNLGYIRDFAGQIDLVHSEPMGKLSSSGYCLANPGNSYLVYIADGDSIHVTTREGWYKAEWFNPRDGSSQSGENIRGGEVALGLPAKGDWVLLLEKDR